MLFDLMCGFIDADELCGVAGSVDCDLLFECEVDVSVVCVHSDYGWESHGEPVVLGCDFVLFSARCGAVFGVDCEFPCGDYVCVFSRVCGVEGCCCCRGSLVGGCVCCDMFWWVCVGEGAFEFVCDWYELGGGCQGGGWGDLVCENCAFLEGGVLYGTEYGFVV